MLDYIQNLQNKVRFECTKEEFLTISKIADRAISDGICGTIESKLDLCMDLNAVHSNGLPLDFDKLLAFDRFNFVHDMRGIYAHIDRDTGKLKNHFVPRCARRH